MLGRDNGGTFEAEMLAPLSTGLAHQFRHTCREALRKIEVGAHVPYSPGRKPDAHEIATIDLQSVAPLVEALGSIEPRTGLNIFDVEGHLASRVDLYVVAVHDEATIHFLRSTSPKKRLKRTNRITAIWRGSVFETLEDDPLLFDTSFDAVVHDGEVYILNQTSLERSLGFLEAARQAAESTVRTAISALAIINEDDFLKAVTGDANMISKTRSIAQRLADPGYAQRMTIDNLIAVTKQHPEIDIDWETNDEGEQRLVFHPDPARRWRILKILDDDYVQSLITDLVYESNSKQHLG